MTAAVSFGSFQLKASNPLPARSDGLDNVDGGPDAAFYIQMGVIEQVSILGVASGAGLIWLRLVAGMLQS
jgi:hypothetical protein